jgi:hypothetical protein
MFTLFDCNRHCFPPAIQLNDPNRMTPGIGGLLSNVSGNIAWVFGGNAVYTANQIEVIRKSFITFCEPHCTRANAIKTRSVGGPDRPIPRASLRVDTRLQPTTSRSSASPTSPLSSTSSRGRFASKLNPIPASSQTERTQYGASSAQDAINWTNQALAMRGEKLQQLGESVGQAAQAAQKYAIETKKMAQNEATKRSLMGGISGFFKS